MSHSLHSDKHHSSLFILKRLGGLLFSFSLVFHHSQILFTCAALFLLPTPATFLCLPNKVLRMSCYCSARRSSYKGRLLRRLFLLLQKTISAFVKCVTCLFQHRRKLYTLFTPGENNPQIFSLQSVSFSKNKHECSFHYLPSISVPQPSLKIQQMYTLKFIVNIEKI